MSKLTPTEAQAKKWAIVDGVLYGADAHVAAWVESRLGGTVVEVPFMAFGILPEAITDVDTLTEEDIPTKLIGGAYFFNHHKGPDVFDISIAVAVDDVGAGRVPVVRRILEYPFGELDLPRMSAEICITNERARQQAENLGFVLEGIKKHSSPTGDDIGMFGLYRDECEFWQRRNRMEAA